MTIIDYKVVGKKIADKRREMGLTQKELADECGISSSYLAHIEAGANKLSLDVAVGISNTLGLDINYLIVDNLDIEDDKITAVLGQLKNCTSEQKEKFVNISQVLLDNINRLSQ